MMAFLRRRAVLVGCAAGVAAALAACASGLPRPGPFHSPVAKAARYTLYLPGMMQPANKLGVTGANCEYVWKLGAAWGAVWAPTTDTRCAIVPMIWDETHVDDPVVTAQEWVALFNECDHRDQCNLAAADAVEPLYAAEQRFAGKKKLVSPATAYGAGWLIDAHNRFSAKYGRPPKWDALALHCYLGKADLCYARVREYAALARQWGISEIWITEFYFREEDEARKFVALIEADPLVTRYAPFLAYGPCIDDKNWSCSKAGDASLFTASGELTAIGTWYARPAPEGP